MYDEKQNTVIIKVVCCSPEKIRDKICYKGGGAIKSIEIIPPQKSKPPEEKKKEPEKTKTEPDKKKEPEKPKADPDKKKEPEKSKDKPEESKPPQKVPVPVQGYPPAPPPMAVGLCCGPCYDGQPGGPCIYGYGGPPQYYDGYYARPVYDSYGGGRPYYASHWDQYYIDQNPSGCSVM